MNNISAWSSVLSDLFVNLSAGWLGAAFVVPAVARPHRNVTLWLLIVNVGFSILFLVLAFQFKRIV